MTERYRNAIRLSRSKGRRVRAEFTGAEVTSNGGAMLLAEADRRMGLTRAVAEAIGEGRRLGSVVHTKRDMVRQRVCGLLQGPEDLNDHDRFRRDPALQAAVMRDGVMASPSTLCRFERKSGPWEALMPHRVPFDQFVAAHPKPPGRIVLEFDATDIELHGRQEGRHCHGHYGKAEHTCLGANTRFAVTSLDMADDPQGLHEAMYCERGEIENRIKDQQLGLFADRASSSEFNANQFRLLLSGSPTRCWRGCAAWRSPQPSRPRPRRRPSLVSCPAN